MINLKLAEYDLKTGKFKEFIEFPYFWYSGRFIKLNQTITTPDYTGVWKVRSMVRDDKFILDPKDPLSRFNGLFDGRTYGEGKFVLMVKLDKHWQDDVICHQIEIERDVMDLPIFDKDYSLVGQRSMIVPVDPQYGLQGNLHEKSELWEKAKNA